MWERKPLNLEFDIFPNERPQFLLGSIALAKKFQRKKFINDDVRSYLLDLRKRYIPVYFSEAGIGYFYYMRGVLERNPHSYKKPTRWVDQYRVITSRMRKIEQELEKTEYVKYLDQL